MSSNQMKYMWPFKSFVSVIQCSC